MFSLRFDSLERKDEETNASAPGARFLGLQINDEYTRLYCFSSRFQSSQHLPDCGV